MTAPQIAESVIITSIATVTSSHATFREQQPAERPRQHHAERERNGRVAASGGPPYAGASRGSLRWRRRRGHGEDDFDVRLNGDDSSACTRSGTKPPQMTPAVAITSGGTTPQCASRRPPGPRRESLAAKATSGVTVRVFVTFVQLVGGFGGDGHGRDRPTSATATPRSTPSPTGDSAGMPLPPRSAVGGPAGSGWWWAALAFTLPRTARPILTNSLVGARHGRWTSTDAATSTIRDLSTEVAVGRANGLDHDAVGTAGRAAGFLVLVMFVGAAAYGEPGGGGVAGARAVPGSIMSCR